MNVRWCWSRLGSHFCGQRLALYFAAGREQHCFRPVLTGSVEDAHALAAHGMKRVAIVDFDVHHGNGTQEIFWSNGDLFYGSTHQMPLYPGTGAASETGVGNIFNAPLREGDGGAEFRAAMSNIILPALHAFGPDLVIISAGFDAHVAKPIDIGVLFSTIENLLAEPAEAAPAPARRQSQRSR